MRRAWLRVKPNTKEVRAKRPRGRQLEIFKFLDSAAPEHSSLRIFQPHEPVKVVFLSPVTRFLSSTPTKGQVPCQAVGFNHRDVSLILEDLIFSLFLKTAILRYNSHAITFILLKCVVPWVSV